MLNTIAHSLGLNGLHWPNLDMFFFDGMFVPNQVCYFHIEYVIPIVVGCEDLEKKSNPLGT